MALNNKLATEVIRALRNAPGPVIGTPADICEILGLDMGAKQLTGTLRAMSTVGMARVTRPYGDNRIKVAPVS